MSFYSKGGNQHCTLRWSAIQRNKYSLSSKL